MKYLKEFNSFLNEEWSKNEPIPEILDKPKGLAIFLIGAPGIGKSYFVDKFIHTKNQNIKDFSTDDVSLLFTKDPNEYKGFEHIKEMFDLSRENQYEIIFIHLLSTLQTSIDQDKLRDRHVEPHYIEWAYAKQLGGMVDGEMVEGNMPRYKALGPDEYYVILSIDKKYSFFKFIDGKLARKKGDKYVPMNEDVDFDPSEILYFK